MDNLEKYTTYRECQRILVATKIIPYINANIKENVVLNSARILGMLDERGNIVPREEREMTYLLDFTIHEYKINGKSMIQIYRENVQSENELEEVILEALEKSYVSLFRVVNISTSKNLVFLKDVFNNVKNVRLTDINCSQTGNTETLLFTRVLPFKEFNMTSGMVGAFQSVLENRLVREFNEFNKELKEKYKYDSESTRMLISFFHFNRESNIVMEYDW
ncbi:hypothetical protein RBU49_16735 [Clostridium sp. MB40-C1]|uniref:hypothetical protein n=1 Tax=Clostridium sp. MB40-C1 TaxID=3070996 RepID=UPI0027DFF957|nr:hypothetical protein [Clostridium sp. MB40-C1]WMJ80429.1 hypothetical protein RBU49_16735 [Clostridium sp. MB40-C1]